MEGHPPEPSLTDLPGIGGKTAEAIHEHGYTTVSEFSTAAVDDLLQIDGVGRKTLQGTKRELEIVWNHEDVFQNTVFLKETVKSEEDALKCETEIVWVEDPRQYEYVREWVRPSARRQAPHSWKKDHPHMTTVGYAIAHPETPSNEYNEYIRRWFFIKPQDLDSKGGPMEAVVPETVSVGQSGIHPDEIEEDDISQSLSGQIQAKHGVPDTSESPTHAVPFLTTRDGRNKFKNRQLHQGKPALFIQQINLQKWCFIAIQMPWVDDNAGNSTHLCLTDDAISETADRLSNYENQIRESGYGTMGALSVSKGDYQILPHMKPETARELADELYPTVMDPENIELNRDNVDFTLDSSKWAGEWTESLFYCQECGDEIIDIENSQHLCSGCKK